MIAAQKIRIFNLSCRLSLIIWTGSLPVLWFHTQSCPLKAAAEAEERGTSWLKNELPMLPCQSWAHLPSNICNSTSTATEHNSNDESNPFVRKTQPETLPIGPPKKNNQKLFDSKLPSCVPMASSFSCEGQRPARSWGMVRGWNVWKNTDYVTKLQTRKLCRRCVSYCKSICGRSVTAKPISPNLAVPQPPHGWGSVCHQTHQEPGP